MLNGMRIIESVHLVEDGWAWLPLGRSGWKAKRRVKVPYRGALRLDATTLVMHPAMVLLARELARSSDAADPHVGSTGKPSTRA